MGLSFNAQQQRGEMASQQHQVREEQQQDDVSDTSQRPFLRAALNRSPHVVTPSIEYTLSHESPSLIPNSVTSSPPQSGRSPSQHSRQQSSTTPPTSIDLHEPPQQEDAIKHDAQSGPSSLNATNGSDASGPDDEIDHIWNNEDWDGIGAQFDDNSSRNATRVVASRRSRQGFADQRTDVPAGLSALRIAILVIVGLVAVAFISFAWHHICVLSKAGDVDPLRTKFILVISTLGLAVSASTATAVFQHHPTVTLLVFIAVILTGENIRRGIGCFVPIAA